MLPRRPHPLSYPPDCLPRPPMPAGIDPTDYRAFYPYTPNEVKHRKRTTSAQLKVLEGVFRRDTKPNAALRTELAVQLNMTARGVQVWFQNRRAKEKTKAAKGKAALTKDVDSPSPRSSEDADEAEALPELSTSSSPSPTGTDTPSLRVEDPPFDLRRRGSLPVNALSYGNSLVDPLDPLARRRSVDASLVRLANNPYAPLARAKNGLVTQRLSQGRQHHLSASNTTTATPPSTLMATVLLLHLHLPRCPPTTPVRASLPDHSMYARNISAPISGPLPSPGFSFGMPTASPDSERNSPVDFSGFSFPRDDADTDDGSTSYQTRFSSIASASSSTSAYYSDVGSVGEVPDFNRRRESCPTGFLNLMSGLDVNGPRRASLAEGLLGSYSERDGVGYPSPSSTVSPGSSPHITGTAPNSSELNYALQSTKQEDNTSYPPRSAGTLDIGADATTFFFDSNNTNGQAGYPHSAPASADAFNYDYSMPYSTQANGVADGGEYHGGMDTFSHYDASTDTPFTYSS
ncbi:hypothetical protein FB45DRAFT_1051717 [Roridomyces roridus]|uniref:Homeobox domain-containing protein n=1 Tax=Roridomyces roridus TaxID=1738132 RepID=A0AAD7FZ44_9AGAR|nr:hypothetical protein FB45DRAFT_1051717 [Roridomyces roridus]